MVELETTSEKPSPSDGPLEAEKIPLSPSPPPGSLASPAGRLTALAPPLNHVFRLAGEPDVDGCTKLFIRSMKDVLIWEYLFTSAKAYPLAHYANIRQTMWEFILGDETTKVVIVSIPSMDEHLPVDPCQEGWRMVGLAVWDIPRAWNATDDDGATNGPGKFALSFWTSSFD